MAIIHLTESSGGATRLSGTNGDLCGLLDWALVQNGWTIDYTSGNKRAYRPGTGNRFIMYVEHDSATSGNAGIAVVRGAESQAAGVLTDAFPTVAQIANSNCNWCVSNAANTTSRPFDIYVAPTWVAYFVNFSSSTNVWEMHFWGDVPPTLASDSYNTIGYNRNVSGAPSGSRFVAAVSNGLNTSTQWYWARSYDGTQKSCPGGPATFGASPWGLITGAAAPQAGPSGAIDSRVVPLTDSGQSNGTFLPASGMPFRGWLPQFREPLHSSAGSTVSRTTFTDTAFNAGSSFNLFRNTNVAGAAFVIFEEDTAWAPPS